MAETITKPKPVMTTPATYQRGSAVAPFAGVVDRTSELSDEVLKSLEKGERAAIEAVGRFVITVEEASSEVARKITESGLEMADRLTQTEYELLRHVIHSGAKSLSSRDERKLQAA